MGKSVKIGVLKEGYQTLEFLLRKREKKIKDQDEEREAEEVKDLPVTINDTEVPDDKVKHLKKIYNRLVAGLTLALVILLGFIVFVIHLNIADVNYNNSLVELVVSQKKQLDEQTKLYNEEVKKFTELEKKFTIVEKTLTDLKKQLEEASQQVSANS